jgi:hypothetical protein
MDAKLNQAGPEAVEWDYKIREQVLFFVGWI